MEYLFVAFVCVSMKQDLGGIASVKVSFFYAVKDKRLCPKWDGAACRATNFVTGQTRLSCLGQKSLSSAGMVKTAKVSFEIRPNAHLFELANAEKSLFFGVFFSMGMKKTSAELLPSRSRFLCG